MRDLPGLDDVLWEQGAGGSNPLTPTILRLLIELLLSGFCAGTAFAARPSRGRRFKSSDQRAQAGRDAGIRRRGSLANEGASA